MFLILNPLCISFQVVKLDVAKQKVCLDDGTEISYDKCLLAPGGQPKNIPVIEQAGEEVLQRTTLFRSVSFLVNSQLCSNILLTLGSARTCILKDIEFALHTLVSLQCGFFSDQ